MSPDGVSTGRVRVGRFTMLVGEPAGTIVSVVEGAARQPPPELVGALDAPPPLPPRAPPAEQLQEAVEDVGEVTSKVERALELFTLVAQGRLDAEAVSKELDALLDLLARLDRAGRFEEALRLARPLHGLLALTLRWVSLVEALRVALHAAETLADVDLQGWVRHELGSLGLGAEDAHGAESQLTQARSHRERSRDGAGLRATDHNLTTLRAAFPPNGGGSRWSTRTLALAGATLLAVVVVGFALAPALDDGPDTDTDTPAATTPATTTTAAPPPPPAGDVVAPRVQITAPQEGATTGADVEIAGAAGSAAGDDESVRLTVHEGSPGGVAVAGPLDVPRDGTTWSRTITLPPPPTITDPPPPQPDPPPVD